MALRAGDRLGPYEIKGSLGRGGMGEVFRARDPRLTRDVAIKVLRGEAAFDPDRVRRFEQEARASGRLSHPNVLTVYDVGSHAGVPYLVSELLDGETLRQRLDTQAIPIRRALDLGVQVARGLAAAHERGIVHRDVKPENLFLTRDGVVKILDFGIACLDRASSVSSSADTATGSGVFLGTPAYASPEQVRGESVDRRTDIFAFGAVLYEALGGRRAFARDTPVETMNAILTEDPPAFPEDRRIPPAVERVVKHCLEKRPEERFQSARDLAFELEGLSGSDLVATGTGRTGRRPAAPGRWLRPAVGALVVVAAVAAGVAVGRHTARDAGLRFQQLTFRRGTVWSARFAADRQTIVYGATWDGQPIRLFTTRAGSAESRALDVPDADLLAISRTDELALAQNRGRHSYVGMTTGTLARAPLAGGAPRALLANVAGADWSPDGRELAFVREGAGGSQLEYPAGTVLAKSSLLRLPRVSPSGELVAFFEDSSLGILVADRSGRSRRLVGGIRRGPNALAWSPDGGEVWFGAALRGEEWAIYAVDLRGRVRVVAELPEVAHVHDVLPDGRTLVTMHHDRGEVMARAPGATEERNVSWLDWSFALDLSQDGRRLLLGEWGRGGARSYPVYARPTDGSGPGVLVAEIGSDVGRVSLSADGEWLLVLRASSASEAHELRLVPTGAGEAKRLQPLGVEPRRAPAWRGQFVLPGVRRVVFFGHEPGRRPRSWLLDVDGGHPRPLTPEGRFLEAISPDGALGVARDEQRRLLLYPIEGGPPRLGAGPPETGVIKNWSSDGRALFVAANVLRGDGLAVAVFRRTLASGRREPWMEVRPADQTGLTYVSLTISADGQAYAYNLGRCLSSLYLIEGLR